ncbi:MAG: response regulator [Phycisphaerales bacterium]|jgi:DNA-binding response OmpR family regulator
MAKSVLIIDDEPAITGALMTRLEAHGHEVYHAINGLAGVEAAAVHEPSIIILDIRMPDIDGFETFERIRRMPRLSRTPIVFLSAHAQEDAKHRARELGATAFLSKPYDSKDILAIIERIDDDADPTTADAA